MAQNLRYGEGPGSQLINNAVDQPFEGTTGQQAGIDFQDLHARGRPRGGLPHQRADQRAVVAGVSLRLLPELSGAPLAEWSMENYNGSPSGYFDMRTGTAYSVNTYFAELQRRAGLCNVLGRRLARRYQRCVRH